MPTIYVEIDDRINHVLIENNMDVSSILKTTDIDIPIKYKACPAGYMSTDSRTKDIMTALEIAPEIILSLGITIKLIASAISEVLETLYRKPYLVEFFREDEVIENGKTKRTYINSPMLLEPQQMEKEKSTEIEIPDLGIIKFSSVSKKSD